MAGEDHGVSKGRREAEREFCEGTVGGQYWDENTFPASKGKEGFADSPILLWRFELAAIGAIVAAIGRTKEIGKRQELFETLGKSIKELGALKRLFPNELKDAIDLQHEDLQDEVAWTVSTAEHKCDDMLVGLLTAGWERIGKKATEAQVPIGTVKEASKARSVAMDEAAESHHEKPGVWKIGDKHVTEIKTIHRGSNRSFEYELHSLDEFQKEYDEWTSSWRTADEMGDQAIQAGLQEGSSRGISIWTRAKGQAQTALNSISSLFSGTGDWVRRKIENLKKAMSRRWARFGSSRQPPRNS